MKRKWNIVNDQSNENYDVRNEIIYNTKFLKSNVCDSNDAYILVRGDITTTAHNISIQVAFENCTPFIKCITKIDGTTIDDVDDLNLVKPMYNVIEYNSNYSEITVSLWFYSKDETSNFNAGIAIVIIILNLLNKRLNYQETLKLMEIMEFEKMQELLCH